jgi:uncharacterized protein with PIN domain
VRQINAAKFIVDHNVGKLAKWLRMMGYDTLSFTGEDDSSMIAIALAEDRIILTRDTHIMERRLVTTGRLKAILIAYEMPELQIKQVIAALKLDIHFQPFSLCLECNQPLVKKDREQVRGRVPPYVFKTQQQYMECPACNRIYWRGTHWRAMTRKLERLVSCREKETG